MNIKGRLLHLAQLGAKDRQTGRTTRLIALAKDIGAVFITHNMDAAKRAERTNQGLVARSMETNLEGYAGPFVMDHFAVETMFIKAANKIELVEAARDAALAQNQEDIQTIENMKQRHAHELKNLTDIIEAISEDRAILKKYINEISEAGYGVKADEILEMGRWAKKEARKMEKENGN